MWVLEVVPLALRRACGGTERVELGCGLRHSAARASSVLPETAACWPPAEQK